MDFCDLLVNAIEQIFVFVEVHLNELLFNMMTVVVLVSQSVPIPRFTRVPTTGAIATELI